MLIEITKFDFAEAIADGWNKDLPLSIVLLRAAKISSEEIVGNDRWDAIRRAIINLYPQAFSEYTNLRQSARTFIASHFPEANALLWDGKPNAARNRIAKDSGSKVGTGLLSRADRTEIKKDQVTDKSLIVIKARSLSQAHDWKTVK